MNKLSLIAVAASAVSAKTAWHQLSFEYSYENYMKEFGKSYPEAELKTRKAIFEQNLASVLKHNQDENQTYKRGINQFSDHTREELNSKNGLDKTLLHYTKSQQTFSHPVPSIADLPESVDWRLTPGVLTPVKNQGFCGSCWAFASAETLESHWALQTGNLQELSEQFILDCTPNDNHCGGSGGCAGGTGELAYDKLRELGGIPSEWTYPYTSGHQGAKGECHGLPLGPEVAHSGDILAAARVTGHSNLRTNSAEDIMDALANKGPLAVSVDAGAWHDYEEGIFTGGNMTNPDLNHLVQLIGYGSDKTGEYWIVRNSWTPIWGEHGYMKLARYTSSKEPCGIDLTPSDGNGCDDGPKTVEVCGQSGILYDGVYPIVI